LDARGNVFYTDLEHVWKISADGRKSIAVRNVHTHELWLDRQGNLYGEHLWYEGEATDRWGHRVWRLAPDGTLTDLIPARAGFRDDYDDFHFVRDGQGAFYWADRGQSTVIRKRSADGNVSVLAGSGFHEVGWMAVSSDGILFLTVGDDLRRISPAGKVTTLATDLDERRRSLFHVEQHHRLMGVWVDGQHNAYVAVYGGGVVKQVTPSGQVRVVARAVVWSHGGLVAPDGDLRLQPDPECRPGAAHGRAARSIRSEGIARKRRQANGNFPPCYNGTGQHPLPQGGCMKKLASALAPVLLVILLGGCYHVTVNTGLTPGDKVISQPWAASWIDGLIPPKTVEAREQCGTAGVARVESQHSFLNSLVAGLTFSIFTPMQIDVTCAQGASPAPAPTPAPLTFEEYVKNM
jgi:sugar lactone lactonase YvrE